VSLPQIYPYWLSTYTTSLHPDYYLAWSGVPGLVQSDTKPILFSSWLPPFHRQVVILIKEGTGRLGVNKCGPALGPVLQLEATGELPSQVGEE
jgi:hypothetical protein